MWLFFFQPVSVVIMSFSCGSTETLDAWHLQFRWLVKNVLCSKMSKESKSLFFLKAGLTAIWILLIELLVASSTAPETLHLVKKVNWTLNDKFLLNIWIRNEAITGKMAHGALLIDSVTAHSRSEDTATSSSIGFLDLSWPSCTVQWYNKADG